MTAPARQPQSYTEAMQLQQSDELRGWARVLVRIIGVLRTEWDRQGLAPGHAYRHAATMLEGFLKERYGV